MSGPAIWLIYSRHHNMWWRPESAGYTVHIDKAGRYDYATAAARAETRDGGKPDPHRGPSEVICIAPETAAELERVRKINAELVQALRRIAPLPQMHGKGCGCAVCEAHAALAKHARAETSDARD